jgi:cell division protease FtsH
VSPRTWPTRTRVVVLGAIVLSLGLLVASAFWWRVAAPGARDVPLSDVLTAVGRGDVAEVGIGEQVLEATTRNGLRLRAVAPAGFTASPAFLSDLVQRHVRVSFKPGDSGPLGGYGSLLLGVALLALTGYAAYRVSAGRIPTLESKARVATAGETVVTFEDVAGVDEAKEEVREIVDFLSDPDRFTALGGRMPKGVLLVGPPGTGKTLLARSMAGEAGVPFHYASGADFVEMYAGVGAARVRRLFRDAARHPRCIVFIDELDAVGRSRGGNSLSHEEREQTLNQLLVEMDGFAAHRGIVVVAATNRPDILDQALLRPGRFDRQVVVGAPDLKGREAILRVHTKKVPLADAVDLRAIARGTPGLSGADLANLVNEAALMAARDGRVQVTDADLDDARDKVLMGVERRSLVMTAKERRNCACHEAGHTLVAALLPNADPLHKVTIVPRGRALGVTMQLPEADRHTHTTEDLETQVAILMGGRAAEELLMGHWTSGASNDIERATDIARKMVCELGMSPLGPMTYRGASARWDGEAGSVMSEETARRVDEEVRAIVLRGYDLARRLLTEHRQAANALAERLLAAESLDSAEIGSVLRENGVFGRSGYRACDGGAAGASGAMASAAGESGQVGAGRAV